MNSVIEWQYNDGGRLATGYKGSAGDCVARAIAIASGRPYQEVYDRLAEGQASQRHTKHHKRVTGKRSARNGVSTCRKWFKDYMASLGFEWVPVMKIGTGCTMHLAPGELPMGRLVVRLTRHLTAVIDGVVNDTYNPERRTYWYEAGQVARVTERCVYGYWVLASGPGKE